MRSPPKSRGAGCPQAILLGNRDHWYRPALDKALAGIAGERGEQLPDHEREFWAKFEDLSGS